MKLNPLKVLFVRGLKLWAVFLIAGIALSIYNFAATIIGVSSGSTYFTALLLLAGLVGGVLLLGVLAKRLWNWN